MSDDDSRTPQSLTALRDAQRRFAAERDWDQFHTPKNLAAALAVEAAELLEPFQWLTAEESARLTPEQLAAVQEEMADVLLYLVRLADKLDVDLIAAARDKILVLLDADKLDVAALKRAMEAERATAEAMHNKRQAALLGAYQKLSVADRKALVAEARAMRARMESRMSKKGAPMMMHGAGGMDGMEDMPPPPPPPAK